MRLVLRRRGMYPSLLGFLLCLMLVLVLHPVRAESNSSSIYSDVEKSVYQVQVINKQSDKKTTIGSAFVVQDGSLIATNYHVVSMYINNPGDYALEYVSTSNQRGSLTLLAVDVVHDLAILRADVPLGNAIKLGEVPPKGARLYSLGNPMDKGFSIVEGTNNGVLKYSNDNNILFSGSLNPGMSGGPALNEQKEVIGVNVATSGNGISFLVPASHLVTMLEKLEATGRVPEDDFNQTIAAQLREHADVYLQTLMTSTWTKQRIGHFQVPSDIEGGSRCWDNSEKSRPDDLLRKFYTLCDNESSIYLDDNLEVGKLSYEYVWLASEEMIPPRFYRRYEMENSSSPNGDPSEQDVTNFKCYTDFTLVSGQEFKMTVCRRDYLNYAGLSDLLITGALVGHKQEGMLFNLDMSGVGFESGMALFKRMLEEFKWQK